MTIDLTRTNVSDYDVTWGSYVIGAVDKVTPDLKVITKPIKVGTLGDIKLGERIIGLEGTVKVEVREIDLVMAKGLMAWAATAGNASPGTAAVSIPLVPSTFHIDKYTYAQALKLHPTHLPASDTTQDLNLTKAVGTLSYLGERDGVVDNKAVIEFEFYPDRAQLSSSPPVISYGTIG